MTSDILQKRGRGRPRRTGNNLAAAIGAPGQLSGPKNINPTDAHVGARLKLRRTLLGISQTELGNLLGLTFQQIQKYEKGQNRLTAGRLMEVARLMGVSVQYFFEDLPELPSLSGKGAAMNAPGFAEDGSTQSGVESFSPGVMSVDAAVMLGNLNRIPHAAIRRKLAQLVSSIANEYATKSSG